MFLSQDFGFGLNPQPTPFVTFSSSYLALEYIQVLSLLNLHSKKIPLTKLKLQLIFYSEDTGCHFPKFMS